LGNPVLNELPGLSQILNLSILTFNPLPPTRKFYLRFTHGEKKNGKLTFHLNVVIKGAVGVPVLLQKPRNRY